MRSGTDVEAQIEQRVLRRGPAPVYEGDVVEYSDPAADARTGVQADSPPLTADLRV